MVGNYNTLEGPHCSCISIPQVHLSPFLSVLILFLALAPSPIFNPDLIFFPHFSTAAISIWWYNEELIKMHDTFGNVTCFQDLYLHMSTVENFSGHSEVRWVPPHRPFTYCWKSLLCTERPVGFEVYSAPVVLLEAELLGYWGEIKNQMNTGYLPVGLRSSLWENNGKKTSQWQHILIPADYKNITGRVFCLGRNSTKQVKKTTSRWSCQLS